MAKETDPKKTIFVRNLPDDVDNSVLEDVFSEVGPVRRCFVVTDKGTGKSRGFGYVTFSTFEDTKDALQNIKVINGQRIILEYSKKRETEKRKKPKEDADDQEEAKPPTKKPVKRPVDPSMCRVLLEALPLNATEKQIQKAALAAKIKNLQSIEWLTSDKTSKSAALVFETKGQAIIATQNFNKAGFKGKKIKVTHGTSQPSSSSVKATRIIVRNLSFKCTEDLLKKEFAKFGEVSEVKIPVKHDGKMIGCGFVQFHSVEEAEKAVQSMNAKPILGRPVAVDWCVSKDKFIGANVVTVSNQEKSEAAENVKKNEKKEKQKKTDNGLKIYNYGEGLIEDKENESEEDELEEEFESEESEESSAEIDDDDDDSDEDDIDDNDDAAEIDDEDGDDEDDEISDENDDEKEEKTKKKPDRKQSDTDEGRTLFVRNLAFDTEEEDMYELFSELGEVVYCRITMNKETEKSRGTGFVQYATKEDADKCLEVANDPGPNGGLLLDERELKVSLALSRDKVSKVVKQRKDDEKEKPDKRNLHLAREGLIRAGTKDAEGVSKQDLDKRQRLQMVFRTKLKNVNIIISPTRLCLHNLPTSHTDASLKKLILKHLKEPSAKINECRIMRDMKRLNAQGVGKSRGYAFVNFNSHAHALKALRTLNNSPDVFTDVKRPIVEFSLENSLILNAKQKRIDRSKAKSEALQSEKGVYTNTKKGKDKKGKKSELIADPREAMVNADDEKPQKPKKGLPSHWGPKIRHKARQPQVTQKKPKENSRTKARKGKMERREENQPQKAVKTSSKRKAANTSDDLDNLISKYRNTIASSMKKKNKGSKWFE